MDGRQNDAPSAFRVADQQHLISVERRQRAEQGKFWLANKMLAVPLPLGKALAGRWTHSTMDPPPSSTLAGIVGSVRERASIPTQLPQGSNTTFGFPAPGHRDAPDDLQRRLAARRAARTAGTGAYAPISSHERAAPAPSPRGGSAARLVHVATVPGVPDVGAILQSNDDRVARMGDEERAAAMSEIESMFSPQTLAAMRARALKGQQQALNASPPPPPAVAAAGSTPPQPLLDLAALKTEEQLWEAAREYLPPAERAKLAWTGRLPAAGADSSVPAATDQRRRNLHVHGGSGGAAGGGGGGGGGSAVHAAFGAALHGAAVAAAASTMEAPSSSHPPHSRHTLLAAALGSQLPAPLIAALLLNAGGGGDDAGTGPHPAASAVLESVAAAAVEDAGVDAFGLHSSARELVFDRAGRLMADTAAPLVSCCGGGSREGCDRGSSSSSSSSGGAAAAAADDDDDGRTLADLCSMLRSAVPAHRTTAGRAICPRLRGFVVGVDLAVLLGQWRRPPSVD